MISLGWTIEERQSRVDPFTRVGVYISLHLSLLDLEPCARRACSAAKLARQLSSYDRARRAAAPLASQLVRARIAEVQRSLQSARRGEGRPRAAPIEALRTALIAEEQVRLHE